MTDDITRARAARTPPDVDAITARAEAAPGGQWVALPESLWLREWTTDTDDDPHGEHGTGRDITVTEHDWHAGSADPGTGLLWTFLSHARPDVLALGAEVRRLRAALAAVARKDAA
jgi:hypothetical protein